MIDSINFYWERIKKPLKHLPGSGMYTFEHPRWVAEQVLWALHNQISEDVREKMWSLIPAEEIPNPDDYEPDPPIVIDQEGKDEDQIEEEYDRRYQDFLEATGYNAAHDKAVKRVQEKALELYLKTFREKLEEITKGILPSEISDHRQARIMDKIRRPIHELKWIIQGQERGIDHLMQIFLDQFPTYERQ